MGGRGAGRSRNGISGGRSRQEVPGNRINRRSTTIVVGNPTVDALPPLGTIPARTAGKFGDRVITGYTRQFGSRCAS